MKRIVMTMLVAVAVAGWAQAASLRAVTVNESAAKGGATHVVALTADDLAAGTTVAEALTNTTVFAVAANTYVEFLGMELVTAFATTNDAVWTNSLTLTVGDGTDADLYLAATQLAADNTEVFFALPPVPAVSVPVGATNVTVAGSVTVYGRKLYTGADTIDFLLTPGASLALDANAVGEVLTYWRVWQH
jgi:hypothetical protein